MIGLNKLGGYCRRWIMRFTHEPTGHSIAIGDNQVRNQHQAREAAVKYLTAKANAPYQEQTKFLYDLGDQECVNELMFVRTNIHTPEDQINAEVET